MEGSKRITKCKATPYVFSAFSSFLMKNFFWSRYGTGAKDAQFDLGLDKFGDTGGYRYCAPRIESKLVFSLQVSSQS